MKKTKSAPRTAAAPRRDPMGLFAADDAGAIPVVLTGLQDLDALDVSAQQRTWIERARFRGQARTHLVVPAHDGAVGLVLLGAGDGASGDPSGPSDLLFGQLACSLPGGVYRPAGGVSDPSLAALAWGLGGYRFQRYRSNGDDLTAASDTRARLALPAGVNRNALQATIEAVWLARDLINTPAGDLGPAEIEAAVRDVARAHDAEVSAIIGDELLARNFPMIHAVGRASPRPPRLIDLQWRKRGGRPDAPRVTLVGKGITFDTGGLDLKPASAMLLMKKDMGGAAVALAVASMIMAEGLDVRLRLLIASAENAVSGDAFRPGDVLKSRAGLTVEIGNTDAEGRLVLADALALADEENPDSIFVFATLTGAARTALGPDLPALFTNDDHLAGALIDTGARIGDPVWRLPLWTGYRRYLESEIADLNNVGESPFAGAMTAALFLQRFVQKARRFAHFDLYGWRPAARPLGPKGGEAQCARAVFEVLKSEIGS